jgi:hypothetical protein
VRISSPLLREPFPATWGFDRRFYEEKPAPATCQAIFIYSVFSRLTADRQAYRAAKDVLELCYHLHPAEMPFDTIRATMEDGRAFDRVMVLSGASLENTKVPGVYAAVKAVHEGSLDICNTTLGELKGLDNIGNKIARFYLMQTAQAVNYALLDSCTHRYFGWHCVGKVPNRRNMSDSEYLELEEAFLTQVVSVIGVGARATHTMIWNLAHNIGGRMATPERLAEAVKKGLIVPTLDWSMV